MTAQHKHENWSSRWAFLMATIGGAVGLGNLWRFPYIAGENGAGGFVLIYLGMVLVLGLPLITAEMMLGRRGQKSAVATIADIVRSENAHPAWKVIGWLSILVPFVGLSYYAVVAAWTLDYLWLSLIGSFSNFDGESSAGLFAQEIARPWRQASLHGAFMAMTVAVVARGVNNGIAMMSKILMPALFGVLLLLVVYGIFAGEFIRGVTFLFAPDFSAITGQSVLIALGQALFSLAIGVGMLITYSAYMPREFSVGRSAAMICAGDTIVALLAGLAIFPIVFANGLSPAEGPGLIFVTLPVAFGQMPGGAIVGPLFFFLLFFAAFSTALGMLEPVVSFLSERVGGRVRVAWLAGFSAWVLGLASVFSFSIFADLHPLGWLSIKKTFFDLLDFGVANLMLPINALLIALFAGWGVSRSTASGELATAPVLFALWRLVVRYLAPVAILVVMVDILT